MSQEIELPWKAVKNDNIYLEMFMATHQGSKVAYSLNKGFGLHHLNLQTGMMCKMFQLYPEVLLMIRSDEVEGKVLYTFLADGPCVPASCNTERIVHLAVPRNESQRALTDMFEVMKDFNTSSKDVRIILVDPHFKAVGAILSVFPSVEVVPSAYHMCRHFQQSLYQLSLPEKTEHLLFDVVKTTMCSPTRGNLENMHKILNRFLKPTMLAQLKVEWLLEDRTWGLHRWRSSSQCFEYFQNIETLTRDFNKHFGSSQFANIFTKSLVDYIQEHIFYKEVLLQEKRTCTTCEMAIIDGKEVKAEEAEPSKNSLLICQSLEDICSPAAFSLCQKELEVARKSVAVIGTNEEMVNVQLLESCSDVSYKTPATCSCNFYQTLQLPCRHILAVTTASEKTVQPVMIESSWQRHSEVPESALPVLPDLLEIVKGEGTVVPEKEQVVESLTNQLSQLLAECSDSTFQQRYKTLRELADAWIGPYEQVKL